MRAFSPITRLRQLLDVLTADRADGRILAWDDAQQAYVHVEQSGGSTNLDGGRPDSNYGGTTAIDGGSP